ncbi:MAG: cation diffusion facilitator family transporter [Ignavibacteriae bacterium HGW-Ignavibacteriae-2]|jgi:cation diffusion facilitator family transporter|nr:MAG: cation diffusion facilitator family transporter [Ignavibacteriae bacterium HGW-Ignavibacteriae-2]
MQQQNKIKFRAAVISLVIGFILFIGKIVAYYLTNSSAIFSDAAESVVHIIATGLVLFSIYLSNKPPDRSHFYGHGNIEYFSAGFEGFLIICAATIIIYSAVLDLIHGASPENLDIGTLIVGAAGVINIFLGYYLIDQGKKTNSIALVADGKHVLTDAVTSIGVIVGLVLIIFTNFYILDQIVAIIVALNIVYTGYKLIRESIGELMNETDKQLLADLSEILRKIKKNYYIDLHHLRFWKSAERVFIDFHLTIPFYFSIKQSHLEDEYISRILKTQFPDSEVRIHMDYCGAELCKFCDYMECQERSFEKSDTVEWSVDKLLGNPINLKQHIS